MLGGTRVRDLFDRWGLRPVVPLSQRKRIFHEAFGASKALTLCAIPVMGGRAAMPALRLLAIGQVVSALADAARVGEGFTADVARPLALLAAALVADSIITAASDATAVALGRRTARRIRIRALGLVSHPVTIGHVERPDLQNHISTINAMSAAHYGLDGAVAGLIQLTATQLSAIGPVVLLGVFRWWLVPPLLVTQWLMIRAYSQHTRKRMEVLGSQGEQLRRADYLRDLASSASVWKELRIFGMGEWIGDRFDRSFRTAMDSAWAQRKHSARPMLTVSLVAAAVHAGVFLVIATAALDGAIDVARVAVLVQAVIATGTAFGQEAAAYGVAFGLAPLASIDAIAAEVPLARDGVLADQLRPRETLEIRVDGAVAPRVTLKSVHFGYDESREVLHGVDLEIEAGTSAAIVGANGAGKTTLVKLLLGLYAPQQGVVLVDGVPLQESNTREWWHRTAVVFQDFLRYPASVAFNVDPASGTSLDPQARVTAAQRAGALEIIEALPNGWDTILSRQFGGAELSGGQWQRIALARTMYAVEKGSSLLVLDEPTAHLDIRAEADFYDRFLDLTHGLTTIIISHRFPAVRRASTIWVVDHGRIVEKGSHETLMSLGAVYARMFSEQAAAFQDQRQ